MLVTRNVCSMSVVMIEFKQAVGAFFLWETGTIPKEYRFNEDTDLTRTQI